MHMHSDSPDRKPPSPLTWGFLFYRRFLFVAVATVTLDSNSFFKSSIALVTVSKSPYKFFPQSNNIISPHILTALDRLVGKRFVLTISFVSVPSLFFTSAILSMVQHSPFWYGRIT